MADQPPFDDGDEPQVPPTEGVRIIKPDEAAEAVERGDAVRRRGDRPKYGDRPEAPDGPRPDLRFPLADSADPTLIVRPKVAPVDSVRSTDPVPDDVDTVDPADQADEASEPADAAAEPAEPTEPVEPPIEPAARVEPAAPAQGTFDTLAAPTPDSPTPPSVDAADEPLLSLPISGSNELPHWTEPATGEVPRVVLGDSDEDDEEARWSSFADQGPRWRDSASGEWDADDTGVADLIADRAADEEAPLGALDTSDRLSDEEFLTFDDLDVPQQPSVARARGSLDDPISIQSEPARPARPTAPGQQPAPAAGRAGATAAARRPVRGPDRGDQPPVDRRPPGPPSPAGRDVPTAILVGVAIATAALILFKLGPAFALGLVVVILVLAGAEFFTAVRRGGFRPATLLGLAAIGAMPLAVYWRGESAIPLVLFLLTAFTALWFILGLGPNATANLGVTVLGGVYIGVFGSYAALMLKIPSEGVSILLVTVVAAVLYDVGGFFVGRQFGRTPLTMVSPNKTVEGLAGGMLASVLGVVVMAVLLGFGPFSVGQALVLGVFCAFAAPVGDLAESVVKRDLGLKDMGSLLPEHGGILDRFDALLFVLPAAYYVCRAFHLTGAATGF